MGCFLERLGGNPSFFRGLAKGETAATEVKRRWNAEGARNAPIAKSLEKPGLEASKCKEACHPVNGYRIGIVQMPPLGYMRSACKRAGIYFHLILNRFLC
jgi:hypothetical protein